MCLMDSTCGQTQRFQTALGCVLLIDLAMDERPGAAHLDLALFEQSPNTSEVEGLG